MKNQLIILMLFVAGVSTGYAQNVNIPDANFKAELVADASINTNADTEIQVSEAQTYNGAINVGGKSINDLTGIEEFVNITSLIVDGNNIMSLDVSALTDLTLLWFNNNQVSTLNLPNSAALTEIRGNGNSLNSLDVSNNTSLHTLYVSNNAGLNSVDLTGLSQLERLALREGNLSSIDISDCVNLLSVNIRGNNLSSLDVTNNTLLETLVFNNNNITSIDPSNCTNLVELNCAMNDLSSLDVSANTTLETLDCSGNSITSLNLSNNTNLDYLDCEGNTLGNIDLSNATDLTYLDCSSSNLSALDLTNNPKLESVNCFGNQLNELDLSANDSLIDLNCSRNNIDSLIIENKHNLISLSADDNGIFYLSVKGDTSLRFFNAQLNELTSIDLSDNHNLENLNLQTNQFYELDVSTLIDLERLYVNRNNLVELNLSANIDLFEVRASENNFYALDFSQNTNLNIVRCLRNDSLRYVNMENGNNVGASFNALLNPSLMCVQVDDSTWSVNNWPNVDTATIFSNDCQYCYPFFTKKAPSICNGDSYTLPNGSNMMFTSDTVISMLVTPAQGCDSVYTVQLSVEDEPVSTISNNSNVLEVAAGYSDYQWYKDGSAINNANSNTFTATENGDYYCEISNNGCKVASDTENVIISGINTLTDSFTDLNVFPNPAQSVVNIKTSEAIEYVRLMDLRGAEVARFETSLEQINVSNIDRGIYFLELATVDKHTVVKLTIQ